MAELCGCMESGNRNLSEKQRCYYGYGNGFIYICELSGGISAGKAEFQEQKGVGISDSGGPDVSAPVVGNLSV